MTNGVLQGSTLGPLFFFVYNNDLPSASELRIRLFANDANLTLTHKCAKSLEEKMNYELLKIDKWIKVNKLSINYNTTEFLTLNKKKSGYNQLSFKISSNEIAQVKQTCYLGVIIDENLTWTPHIQNLCTKLARGVRALTKLQKYINQKAMKTAYYGLVSSSAILCFSLGISKQNID